MIVLELRLPAPEHHPGAVERQPGHDGLSGLNLWQSALRDQLEAGEFAIAGPDGGERNRIFAPLILLGIEIGECDLASGGKDALIDQLSDRHFFSKRDV